MVGSKVQVISNIERTMKTMWENSVMASSMAKDSTPILIRIYSMALIVII